jgi:hypothetical protein
MTEAEAMYAELLHTLQHLIPRTTYQESRRLNTLVWAITGLCLTQTVRLSAWLTFPHIFFSNRKKKRSRERMSRVMTLE